MRPPSRRKADKRPRREGWRPAQLSSDTPQGYACASREYESSLDKNQGPLPNRYLISPYAFKRSATLSLHTHTLRV